MSIEVAFDSDTFRRVMGHFVTGVTVVTTILDGRLKGFTANAFSSVSADPPKVLVCVNRQGRTHPLISQAGKFCVNLLTVDQEDLARAFASRAEGDPFAVVPYRPAGTGAPIIVGALAYLDCLLAEEYTAGTHTIFVGEVVDCDATEGSPLGYFDGAYRDFGVHAS